MQAALGNGQHEAGSCVHHRRWPFRHGGLQRRRLAAWSPSEVRRTSVSSTSIPAGQPTTSVGPAPTSELSGTPPWTPPPTRVPARCRCRRNERATPIGPCPGIATEGPGKRIVVIPPGGVHRPLRWTIINLTDQAALWASLISVLVGAGVWGLSKHFGNYGGAHKGQILVLGGASGALLASMAPAIVNGLFGA
jgi:hypothetical protein